MKKNKPADNSWYRLDNSAKIYPAIMSDRQTTLFRITLTLKETIDPDILQKALENSRARFLYFNVSLRNGMFWNYLEENRGTPSVHCDTPSPCESIKAVYYNGFLYKVLYFKKRIAVEFSHVMSDGYGALELTKAIVLEYLRLTGCEIENDGSVIELDSDIDPGEISDDHKKYSAIPDLTETKDTERNLFGGIKAFQMKERLLPVGEFNITTGIIPSADLKKISKSYGATITELLVAIYLESLIKIQKEQVKKRSKYKDIAIQVPVNMRNMLDSNSMRNFSLFVTPTITPKSYMDLEWLVKFVKEFVRENATLDKMMKLMRDNVSVGENPMIRHMPLFMKLPITKFIASTRGSTQHSGTLSNLGLLRLPPAMMEHIDHMSCNLGPDPHSKTTGALLGFKENIYITFGRVIRKANVEKLFFRRLRELGAHIKIQSNC